MSMLVTIAKSLRPRGIQKVGIEILGLTIKAIWQIKCFHGSYCLND